MEVRKSDKANLENKRGVFMELGYVIALALVLAAFEWSSTDKAAQDLGQLDEVNLAEEMIPITRQKPPEPPPPPPPAQQTESFEVVDDDMDIEDELILDDTEADQNTQVEIAEFDMGEEEEEEEPEVFYVVEDMPTFQGKNKDAFRTWIQQNLEYPQVAAENGISGRVFVSFVVDENGNIINIQVARGVDPSLDREAIRVVKNSPKWEPGKQRGRPVRVSFTFPIVFQLQ
ncbi:MAG: energy transducer TonB [Bacteroidota bacterium]